MLQALDIGGPIARDCMVEEIQGPASILKRLEGQRINVEELDYLAKRLDSFSDNELAQFQGMAAAKGFSEMTDLINLTFCCQQATVITDFTDLEQIGKEHYMNLHGGCASIEELERLDAREIALDLILNDTSGQITPYGVVYANGMRLERLYDGCYFPKYTYSDSLMDVSLTSIHNHRQTVFLSLPMSERQIERLIFRSGFESEEFADLTTPSCEFPQSIRSILEQSRESVFDLNRLCSACSTLSQQDWDKLVAAVPIAAPENSVQLRRLVQNLDLFDFVPGVHTPEEYGRHMIRQSGAFGYDSNLGAFYNYEKYGRLRRTYLKEHRTILYTDLVVTEKLFPHLEEIDTAHRERLEIIEEVMMQQEGVTEDLKSADQMAWVRSMNSIHNRAEKIVLAEMAYC